MARVNITTEVDGIAFADFVRTIIKEAKKLKKKGTLDEYFLGEIPHRRLEYREAKELAQSLADEMLQVFGVYKESTWEGRRFGYVESYGVKILLNKRDRHGFDLQCEAVLPTKMCKAVEVECSNKYYLNHWLDLAESRL